MKNTRQNGEKIGYKVILLLVVGLTAFSSAMKELNQLQQFTLEATHLVAQWSDKIAPAEVPAAPQTVEVPQTSVKVETCELKQSLPSVELPWLSKDVPPTPPAPRAIVPRPTQIIVDVAKNMPKATDFHVAKLKKIPQIDFDPSHFNFTFTTDTESDPFVSELPVTQWKAKARRVREIRINTRDREMQLKNLNRSISLRIAS